MKTNREAKTGSALGSNGGHRRRQRASCFRDSSVKGGVVELQESVNLKEKSKKYRNRERMKTSGVKRRSGKRLASNNKDSGGDESSEESVNDEDEETSAVTNGGVRLLPGPISDRRHHHNHSISLSNSNNSIITNNHLQHVKTFPPGSSSSSSSSKVFRTSPVWKSGDDMINVPRKARSVSSKRPRHRISSCVNNKKGIGAAGEEKILWRPLRSPTAAHMSPSSSNASLRKKLKSSRNIAGSKVKPPKASSEQSFTNPDKLEIEIAEVLYGLRTQSRVPVKEEDGRADSRSNSDPKSKSLEAAGAAKRKRPREVIEKMSNNASSLEMDQTPQSELSSQNLEKKSKNGVELGDKSVNLQEHPQELNPECEDFIAKEDESFPKAKESSAVKCVGDICRDLSSTATAEDSTAAAMIEADSIISEAKAPGEQKLSIDPMAPAPHGREITDNKTPTARELASSNIDAAGLKAVKNGEDLIPNKRQLKNTAHLATPMSGCPGGFHSVGNMAPYASMDAAPAPPAPPLYSQCRSKRCATHGYIARNIQCLQQFMKINNPFWQAAVGSASLLGFNSNNLNPIHHTRSEEKGRTVSGNSKGFHTALPRAAPPSNFMGSSTIAPNNQHQAVFAQPSSINSGSTTAGVALSISSTTPMRAMSYNYSGMAIADRHYLSFLQNNPFHFRMPPTFNGAPIIPVVNGSFYPPQMIQPFMQFPKASQNATLSSNSAPSQNLSPNLPKQPQDFGSMARPSGINIRSDSTSMAQNRAVFQSFPEANRRYVNMAGNESSRRVPSPNLSTNVQPTFKLRRLEQHVGNAPNDGRDRNGLSDRCTQQQPKISSLPWTVENSIPVQPGFLSFPNAYSRQAGFEVERRLPNLRQAAVSTAGQTSSKVFSTASVAPGGFGYLTPNQVKPSEQKQPAG
ncbi:protein TIME FOR COFFEE-like isoform X3 [Andrographis paniculata]|uniref:protein TIME FOR COFFEE-like isoform X3 n=1 Tax=Andrographis paniculata TaxID=175694 RepID=UPI0021E83AE2|nr:protein TIME FOR COFFEE-like isoform X3 [Andrographis paniculata]